MVGIVKDYEDLSIKYNAGLISFEEYKTLCEIRSKNIEYNQNAKSLDYVNKEIISNSK